jgi:MFS family permease
MEKLWTRPFIQLTISMFFLFTGFYLLLPTLPLFIKQLGGNESQIGLIVGIFTISAVIFRPIIGGLLDRYGRKPFMVWGVLLFVLSVGSYHWVSGILLLIGLRLLHGMSWALSTTSVGTSVTDLIPRTRRGEGMGWYGMAMTIAMALGPMLGVWIVKKYSFQGLFLFATIFSIIALLFVVITKVPFQVKSKADRIEFFDRAVLPSAVGVFFLAIPYGGITTFLPLFAESIKVNAGTFFLVYAIALTLIRPVAGKLTDRYGELLVIIPSLLITISSLVVLGFSNGLVGIVASAILYGIGFGSAQPAIQAATINLAHPERKGVATASFFTAFDLGIGLGAMILGWLFPYISGYQHLFMVCAVSVVASFFTFAIFVRRSFHKKGETSI